MQFRSYCLLLLVLFTVYANLCHGKKFVHTCIHGEIAKKMKPKVLKLPIRQRFMQNLKTSWRNISITFDYSNLANGDAAKVDFIKNWLVPEAGRIFSSFLQVKYVPGLNLNLPSSLTCNGVQLPATFAGKAFQGDLLALVSYTNDPNAGYVAYAGACTLHPLLNQRPLIAIINFNLFRTSLDPYDYRSMMTTIIHEVIHALGFSPSLFSRFVQPNGTAYPEVMKQVTRRGVATAIFTLPKLVALNRAHFNCANDEGPELENQGGSGSLGAHWERRNYMNELMTASVGDDQALSNFTLTLLESTGWYQINYQVAQALTWGKGLGCNFLTQPCVDKTGKPNFPGFCNPNDQATRDGCTNTRYARGACSGGTADVKGLPQGFQYGQNTLAGDVFSDNCPYYVKYSNGLCVNPNNTMVPQPGRIIPWGQNYSPASRCFRGTFWESKYAAQNPNTIHSTCTQFKCLKDAQGRDFVQIIIGGGTVNCPAAGGNVTNVPGHVGNIECPDGAEFCSGIIAGTGCQSSNGCAGVGACFFNKCFCPKGKNGPTCA